MAGKGEEGGALAADREQILDRAVGRVAVGEAVDLEALRFEHVGQHILRARILRRDAGAGDQLLGKVDGIDRHGRAVA